MDMQEQVDLLADSIFRSVRAYCETELERRFADLRAQLPQPRDGIDGKDGAAGAPGERGEKGDAGIPGMAGRDGERGPRGERGTDGRDAYELDVLECISDTRRYPRGTVAHHNGGLVRAFRTTEPLAEATDPAAAGWQVIVRGVHEVEVVQTSPRQSVVRMALSDGVEIMHALQWPTPIFRGVWQEADYEPGDMCQYDGSLWHCDVPTAERPGVSSDWTLAVRRGRDGKGVR